MYIKLKQYDLVRVYTSEEVFKRTGVQHNSSWSSFLKRHNHQFHLGKRVKGGFALRLSSGRDIVLHHNEIKDLIARYIDVKEIK